MKGNRFGILDTGDDVDVDFQTVQDNKLKKGKGRCNLDKPVKKAPPPETKAKNVENLNEDLPGPAKG